MCYVYLPGMERHLSREMLTIRKSFSLYHRTDEEDLDKDYNQTMALWVVKLLFNLNRNKIHRCYIQLMCAGTVTAAAADNPQKLKPHVHNESLPHHTWLLFIY